jgi:hypothetical protein
MYFWGAQLELGSTATTYKPTTVKNLLGYTEHFDNAAWTKSNASISATKVDDIYGQPFAQKLVENATASAKSLSQGITGVLGTVYTYSVYAKRAERKYLRIIGGSVSFNLSVNFDLDDGSYTITGGGGDVSAVSVGNGWYKCSITRSATGTSINPFLSMALTSTGAGDYTGDGTSGIYIFGAQLSDSASVDPYVYQPVAAPTSTAYYGPRFDYDPVTLAPKGLLIEEQRTNLVLNSASFRAWNANANTSPLSVDNVGVSPEGTTTAWWIPAGATSFNQGNYTIPANTATYAWSVYVKALDPAATVTFSTNGINGVNLTSAIFTFSSLAFTGAANGTVAAVGNGWYRLTQTFTNNGTGTLFIMRVDSNASTNAKVLFWGAQLEAGAFATSYIPTVASQVTRAADNVSMIGNNFARWFSTAESSFYVAFDVYSAFNYNTLLQVAPSKLYGVLNSSSKFQFGAGAFAQTSNSITTSNKAAYAFVESTRFVYGSLNGGAVASNSAVDSISGATSLNIGNGFNYLNGHISRIAYYNRRLANSELQSITA